MNDCDCKAQDGPRHRPHSDDCSVYNKAMSYCSTLKTYHVVNVLRAEADRMQRHPEGDVHDGAKELYQEAREELLKRGFDPDEEL